MSESLITKTDSSDRDPYSDPVVIYSQFISYRLLSLILLTVVFPLYGLYSNQFTLVTYSLVFGAILWVWKWRWWWEPLQNFVNRQNQ